MTDAVAHMPAGAQGLPDPGAARRSLISLLGFAVQGMVVKYTAETEAQARQAFDIAAEIAGKARAKFRVVGPILEVQHPDGGAVLCRWRGAEESVDVLE